MGKRAAVFLDRDGTINKEIGYITRPEDLVLIKGVPEAIRLLNSQGFLVIVVTNQSAVARGYMDEETLGRIHKRLSELLEMKRAVIDGFYYCPHHPNEGKNGYMAICSCRKPRPGLIQQAANELNVDLSASFMIGDTLRDLEAGIRAGVRPVLVLTGKGKSTLSELPEGMRRKVHVEADLLSACKWICGF